jgi:hypothetical protein
MFTTAFFSLGAQARLRVGVACMAIAIAPLATACAAEADEQGGPQFPHGEPIGTTGPRPDPAPPPVANDDWQAPQQEQEEVGQPSVVIGGEEGEAPVEPPTPEIADEYSDTDPSALSDFHQALDPYGQWVEDPTYGTIWQPAASVVGADFAPYETGGHWAYGDDYVWVSDYSWGWAPFHYGRWVYATNGWGWVPGRRYAGAWTTWRRGYGAYGNYVGWAPLPPTYGWWGGRAVGLGAIPPAPYAFCNTGNLFAPSLGGRMVTGPQVGAIGQSSRPTTGSVARRGWNGGGGSVGASPFAGRTVAHPEVTGPTPRSMGIAQNAVTRPPLNNPGLNRAAQFARPSTAMALGAHAPAGYAGAAARGGLAGRAGGATYPRPYASSLGTSAYGHYDHALLSRTRTIGGGGYAQPGWGHGGFGGHSAFGHSAFGNYSSSLHNGWAYGAQGFHGMGPHGPVVAAPSAKSRLPEEYGGGYHPSSRGRGRGGRGGGRR